MQAAWRKRVGVALAISVLPMALFAGCRSRPPGMAPVRQGAPTPVTPQTPDAPSPAEGGSRIRGRIVDELGSPPAATVYVLRWKGDDSEDGPITDAIATLTPGAKGEFAFDLVAEASNELRIDVAGLPSRSLWLPVDRARSPILMLGTRTLHGTVRDPEGRPVAGALVRVNVWPEKGAHGFEGTPHGISTRTQSDGSYRFDRLPAGKGRITVEGKTAEGQEWSEEAQGWFVGSVKVARVDLGLPTRLPRVTVRVRAAPRGELKRVVLLTFRSAWGGRRNAGANADGTYAIRLPPGTYEVVMAVSVEHDGVYREGEAALLDAAGRPATLTILPDTPDPTFDVYLPPR